MSIKEQKKNKIKQSRNKKYKTLIKNIDKTNEVKENLKDEKELKKMVSEAQQILDKAAQKKIIHKNKAARKKSQLQRNLNKLKQAEGAQK